MVSLKTKEDKHVNDNERRRKSLKEKEKAKLNQSNIIKQALASCLDSGSHKKIIFHDDDGDNSNKGNATNKNENGEDKTELFDGANSEDENFEIKEQTQFSGRKGLKLLDLQSTYGNDERFKIDKRFIEEENSDSEKIEDGNKEETNDEDEKVKQLKILENVLGQPMVVPESEKKAKKRMYEMVRYDVSNKDHEKYEIKTETKTGQPPPSKKRREGRISKKSVNGISSKPQVSKEKFYEVSSDIKVSLKEKKDISGEFSLLQTYGQNDPAVVENETEEEEQEEMDVELDQPEQALERNKTPTENKFKEQKNVEYVERPQASSGSAVAQGIWKDSFFFVSNDNRFKEGLDFINKHNSDEAYAAAEKYDKTRRTLKEILRLHMKKQLHRKDPFKNKIGGMNKKQLASLKSKNSKFNFNRRKPPKMNPGGRA